MEHNEAQLKQLNFVPEYGSKGYFMATNVYSTAKDKLPASLKAKVDQVEETVTEASAPYITKAQDKGSELLKIVDDQVDKAMQSAGQVYQSNSSFIQTQLGKQRELHQKNLESYKAAREQYLKKIEDSVEFLKSNGLTGAAKKAADEVSIAVTEARKLPSAVASKVHDAFERLMAFEPVKKAMTTAKPTIDAAYTKYVGVHDAVVASPQYKKAFDLSQAAFTRAQQTYFFQKAMQNFYPLVSKYADPAVAQITASPYYQAAVEHVTPKVATA
ncbi:hypothetical protein Ndes2526B_g05866 [Nannochloris sp. 'desiccata']|nr:hypothetical protein KSW81_007678 [Chlorella desiccata (nom. nud.)]KAH7618923.1 hypothetical protein NADE_005771 [Chlorella desiccata (nom. nud.)]